MSALPATADLLVIGAGIVGITVALAWKRRFPGERVVLIDKEDALGAHASGRNSGVIHAGFYYSADSLKARFCREGNRRLRAYIRERGLALNPCGKLVVARDESQLPALDELLRRGRANGVEVEMISATDAKRREPRVRTHERALWSPTTASADPLAVIRAFAEDAEDAGIALHRGVAWQAPLPTGGARTSAGDIAAGYVINAAGLYADRVAQAHGFCQNHVILPFKGLYLYSDQEHGALNCHIYPVPDLAYPFLGVHATVTVDGHAKLGPTAMPAFWRENYHGFDHFRLGECADILTREAGLLIHAGFDFRGLAVAELRKAQRSHLVAQARELLDGVTMRDHRRWGRPGIRAQLLDRRTRTLVMDFLLEGDARSLHVLNAVSPAWTCSLPFADHVVAEAVKRRS
jgi:L-2-hydroxyglutarate oxidase LhgO